MQNISRAVRALVACAGLITAPAFASWTCSGKIYDLTVDPKGNVYMGLLNSDNTAIWSYKQLCSVQADVAVSSCKVIYAHLLTAEALDKSVTFWFDKDGVTTADCSPTRFPSWSYLATTGSSGWYFGPRMTN